MRDGGEEGMKVLRWRCERDWSGADAEEVDCSEFEDRRTFSYCMTGQVTKLKANLDIKQVA